MGKSELATVNESIAQLKRINPSMGNVSNDKSSAAKMSPELAEFKANLLVEKFNAPNSRLFFLKCIYHLSEYEIQNAVERSQQPWVKSPIKYFVKYCYSKLNG